MAASLRVAVVLLLACCALVHQASAVDVDRSRSKARAEVNAEAFAALQREQAEFRALLEDAQPAPAAAQPAQNQVPANATVVPVSATGKPPAVPIAAQPAKNNSRRPDLTTGYGLYTGLLMRVKNNANSEKRAVFLSNTTEQTECNTTLTRVNTSLATRRNQVEAARNTIIVEERKIFTAEWELNTTILPLLNFKRRQQYSVNSTVADGDVRRNLEARIFANKTADAQTVLNAVRAVSMLLHSIRNGGATPQNGTGNATVAAAQARFREKMEEASSQIHDPELMRFVEATMQTFQAVANSSNASAPSNATSNSTLPSKETDGMRLLIHLLRSQIQQYMAQLSRADAANNETWTQTRLQLTAQLAILTEEVSKLDADRLAEERKIATATEIRNNQVTLINSNLLNEIAILEKEQATIMADCDFKLTAMNNQTQSLNDLLGTVAALEKLDFTRQDESVLKRIMENIKLPPADRVDNTGKRCCMVCRRGRKACGNRCVLAEETCSAAPGCACDLSGFRRS